MYEKFPVFSAEVPHMVTQILAKYLQSEEKARLVGCKLEVAMS